jgi:hypothetical protein
VNDVKRSLLAALRNDPEVDCRCTPPAGDSIRAALEGVALTCPLHPAPAAPAVALNDDAALAALALDPQEK